MEQRLKNAAQEGNIDALYALFRENPYILEDVDKIPFADTPLHIAASAGSTHFAVEMISLKPSFGRKLNPDGLSPLHLALQNGHTEIVMRLINIDSELIRVQGKERITPLHHVAERNEFDLFAEFLCACPATIKDLTVRGETAVHIATRNGSFQALEVLLGWLHKFDNEELENWKVLNWKDEDGNTALHIAASTNQLQLVKLLIKNEVDISARNLEGKTPVDLSEGNEEVRNMLIKKKKKEEVRNILACAIAGELSKASSSRSKSTSLAYFVSSVELHEKLLSWMVPNMSKRLSSDMLNTLMVVAALIATVTYQIVLQPPGGFRQERDNNNPNINIPFLNSSAILNSTTTITTTIDHYISPIINNIAAAINSSSAIDDRAGTVVMSANHFNVINVFNSVAFATSIGVIVLALPRTYLSVLLENSLIFLALSYLYTITLISPSLYSVFISFVAYLVFVALLVTRDWILHPERRIFRRVPLCRFNPSHYVEMRHQLVGW